MAAQILNGKELSIKIKEDLRKETEALKEKGINPGLAVIIVGDDPASRVYVNNKKKACEECGFYSEEYALPKETTEEELLKLIDTLNNKKEIPPGKCGKNYDWQLRLSPLYTGRCYGAYPPDKH